MSSWLRDLMRLSIACVTNGMAADAPGILDMIELAIGAANDKSFCLRVLSLLMDSTPL